MKDKKLTQKSICKSSGGKQEKDEEIVAEYLRASANNLERILGKVDVEDVLGNIFKLL